MCGIVGALDLTGNRDFPAERLRAMARAIAHRGPDDEYFHREPGLALGTRRLPIVDAEGRPTGLVNIAGIIHWLVQHFPQAVYNLPPVPNPTTQEREGP